MNWLILALTLALTLTLTRLNMASTSEIIMLESTCRPPGASPFPWTRAPTGAAVVAGEPTSKKRTRPLPIVGGEHRLWKRQVSPGIYEAAEMTGPRAKGKEPGWIAQEGDNLVSIDTTFSRWMREGHFLESGREARNRLEIAANQFHAASMDSLNHNPEKQVQELSAG
jgi:hypothetical protein